MRVVRAFVIWCTAIVALYGVFGWIGWAFTAPAVRQAPETFRQQPGGYRTFTYWRGGK